MPQCPPVGQDGAACQGSWAVRPTSDQTRRHRPSPLAGQMPLTVLQTGSRQQVPRRCGAAVVGAAGLRLSSHRLPRRHSRNLRGTEERCGHPGAGPTWGGSGPLFTCCLHLPKALGPGSRWTGSPPAAWSPRPSQRSGSPHGRTDLHLGPNLARSERRFHSKPRALSLGLVRSRGFVPFSRK